MKLNDILNETELLLELGDAPYPWQWRGQPDPDSKNGYSKSGHVEFTDGEDKFKVDLYYNIEKELTTIFWDKNDTFVGSNTEKSAVRVIFTIMDIIRQYVGLIRPRYIQFSANKAYGSRGERNKLGSLYTTMIKRFATRAGYSAEIEGDAASAKFLLTRRDKKSRM